MAAVYTFGVNAVLSFDIPATNLEEAIAKAKAALAVFEIRMLDGPLEAFTMLEAGYVTVSQVPGVGQVEDVFYTEDTAEIDAEIQREIAREAGMGLGVNAYNDAMGFGAALAEENGEDD